MITEYIKIVLDIDNPSWRNNTSIVRVKIPIENCIPGQENKLEFISNYPKRLYDWGQVAMICHELRWGLDCVMNNEEICVDKINKIIKYLNEVKSLSGIFGDKSWGWGQNILNEVINPSMDMAKSLLNDKNNENEAIESQIVVMKLSSNVERLSSYLAIGNDYALKRSLWEIEREHDF